jgi:cytochrome c peroxidase
MNTPMDVLIDRLKSISGYQKKFDEVFPGEGISEKNIAASIATFERTIVSAEAPFDRWVGGDEKAIGEDAKRGFILFNTKANCMSCHSGWTFTDDSFHDIGVPGADSGRSKIIEIEATQFAFKTPTLRGVASRPPYMHNGSEATLESVIELYDRGGRAHRASLSPEIRPLHLSAAEKRALVAFLRTLDGTPRPVSLPMLPR